MGKRIIKIFFLPCILFILLFSCINVMADSFPRATLMLTFRGVHQSWAVTLLSSEKGLGPWEKREVYDPNGYGLDSTLYSGKQMNRSVWDSLNMYKDNYYFLGTYDIVDPEHPVFRWNYFPPEEFKILLYNPDSERYMESEIVTAYGLSREFTVDVNEADAEVRARSIFDWNEYFKRLLLTILIELGIALCFKYWKKMQWLIVIAVNFATQTALSLGVYFYELQLSHPDDLVLEKMIHGEEIIAIVEGFLYLFLLEKANSECHKVRPFLYSFLANFVSFVAGLVILR